MGWAWEHIVPRPRPEGQLGGKGLRAGTARESMAGQGAEGTCCAVSTVGRVSCKQTQGSSRGVCALSQALDRIRIRRGTRV